MDAQPSLETERLRLEPIQPSHAEVLFGPLSDPRIYRFIPQDPPISIATLAYRYRMLATRRSPDGTEIWLNWAIRTIDTNEYIGIIEVTIGPDRAADLAYIITPARWRQGFAAAACKRIIECLFNGYGLDAVRATIDTRNAASIALVHALGFRQIAVRRDAARFKGSPSDEVDYVLVRP